MQPDNVRIHLPGGMNMPPFGVHQYLALIIVAVSLWALGSGWMGLQATGQWVGTWQQQMVLHVYLPQEHKKELKALQEGLQAVDGVGQVEYMAREDSAKWMRQWLGNSALDVQTLSERLPETLLVRLLDDEAGQFVADDIREVAERRHALINEDEVALLGMREVLDKVEVLAWFVSTLLALAMALIVSNTLRMILLARANEVHLMRLLGAKEWFVRMPFVLEGVTLGAGAGLLAWLLLWPWVWGSSEWLEGSMVELHVGILFLPLLIGGALLGCVGALIATARLVSPDSVVES
ncbi:MAG: permease-like cell division protein FtsX [Mariprofundaceae bacterium]|nr:permease-like cell division protein FtsX [Mariprofundaceae bacterium]